MRAMAVTAYDAPLSLIELPEPQVPAGFALLDILTCGVCFSDVKTARGLMPFSASLSLPHVPGHEIFGRVTRTNPPDLIEPGTLGTVFHYWPCGRCASCRRGDETLCSRLVGWIGFTEPGGFRERIAVPVDRVIPIPPSVDAVHAAPMSCALGTSYRATITRGRVRAGEVVVVLGLGGVGMHAAQVARAAGATVVGVDVHEATLAAALELGLDARMLDGDGSDSLLHDVDGADAVIETTGRSESLAYADRLVRPGGRIVCVGYAPDTAMTISTPRIVLGEIEVIGSRYAHRDDLEHAVELVSTGRVRPVVSMVRPLEEVNEVFSALEEGRVVGRAVLDVAGVRD